MAQSRFSAYPAVFDALTLSSVINTDVSLGIAEIAERSGGTLDVGARAVASRDLQVKLAVLDLAQLANISPTIGLAVNGQTLIQHHKRADGGTFDSGSHVTLKFFKGFLAPESIEASQDSNTAARLMLAFWGLYDGTNGPLSILSQALTGTPNAAPTIYRLAAATINGNLVEGNKSSRVNFGINYQVTRGNGEQVAREGSIYSRMPTINLEPTDLTTVLSLTVGTQTRLAGNVVAYFQKEGVAGNVGEHIAATLVRPTVEIGNVAAGIDDDPRPGLVCKATAGGTIAINTTATLP